MCLRVEEGKRARALPSSRPSRKETRFDTRLLQAGRDAFFGAATTGAHDAFKKQIAFVPRTIYVTSFEGAFFAGLKSTKGHGERRVRRMVGLVGATDDAPKRGARRARLLNGAQCSKRVDARRETKLLSCLLREIDKLPVRALFSGPNTNLTTY